MEYLKDNVIIICEYQNRVKILKKLTTDKKLLNIKFLTKQELMKGLYFDYNEETILYLIEKYKYNYEVSKQYLDNLIFIENKPYKNEKTKALKVLKNELEEQKLLIKDQYFKELIKDKEIIFTFYDYFDKFDQKVINRLKETNKVTIIEKDKNNYNHDVYNLETIEEEVEFVTQQICELIDKGIKVNKIKLTNIDETYILPIKRMFNLYDLPISLEQTTIYQTEIGQTFIKNYQNNIEQTINILNDKYKDKEIINQIINICNKYIKINNFIKVKELIINDLKNTNIKKEKLENEIEIINYNNLINDDEYVFMLNFNQISIPKTIKDEQFITDNMKEELNLSTTKQINKLEKQSTINNIKNIKNLTITYKNSIGKEIYYPSNLVEEMNLKIIKKELNNEISYSQKANKIRLAKKLDNLKKYNLIDESLKILYSNYQIPYQEYNNSYQNINKKELYEYLDNKLSLSYSSMDKYNKCAFSYYISNILKLDPYETNYAAKIGSIFHYCLELGLKEEIDIEETVNNFIKEQEYIFTNKEQFFIEKTKKEIQFTIDTIKEQMKHCNLKNILTEEEIIINKDKTLKVTFKGIIDKMLYNDNNVVAIIDYKTGQTDIKLNLIDYGLSMQLPVYLYLASNSDKLTNPTFAGFYIQQVLNKEIIKDQNKTKKEQKENNLKLNGYSNENINILKEFDDSYSQSEVIKGLKQKQNGEFYSTSKTITNEEINKLTKTVDNKIDETIINIEESNFNINPKIINNNNVSCQYCKYKDLCYMQEKDKIYITTDKEDNYDQVD